MHPRKKSYENQKKVTLKVSKWYNVGMANSISKKKEHMIMEEYWRNGMNATEAVLSVFPHWKRKVACEWGCRITKKYREKTAIIAKKQDAEMEHDYVLSVMDRRKILSDIAKGKMVRENGEVVNTSAKDRISAIKQLNVMDGIGTSVSGVVNNTYNLSLTDERRMISDKIDKILEGEFTEAEDDSTGES